MSFWRNLWLVFLLCGGLRAEVTLQAYGEIPANALDTLGDTIGGIGSAVAYDAKTGDVLMMPDRGAGDGTISYRPRYYRIRITPDPANPKRLDCQILETILFRDTNGRPFTGLLPDSSSSPMRGNQRCLDPEALAVAPDGSLYVSDEYGPSLLHFSRDGQLLRDIPLPNWVQPRDANGALDYRQPSSTSGRDENRGAEAIGILPGGKRAVLIFQSALVQDGGKAAGTSRILVIDLNSGKPVAEYAYAFGPAPTGYKNLSINDLAVLDAHTFLVLERDGIGRSGPLDHKTAEYKAVWLVDVRKATNLLKKKSAPFDRLRLESGFTPLTRESPVVFARKQLLFNLPDLLSQLGMKRRNLAAKWEGVALVPSPSKNTLRLLMTADNDFLSPSLQFEGVTTHFPRAKDRVPTQIFEILIPRP